MAFQPIVQLRTMETAGVEALARFEDAARTPDTWFADATEVGLGLELELAAARLALQALNELGGMEYLSVNASPRLVCSPELEQLMTVSGSRVVVEVTEHAVVADYEALLAGVARRSPYRSPAGRRRRRRRLRHPSPHPSSASRHHQAGHLLGTRHRPRPRP